MRRNVLEAHIQKIAVTSAYLVEQVQWESVEPKIPEVKRLISLLEEEINDLKTHLGE